MCARRRRHVVAKPRETDGGCVVDVLDVVRRARARRAWRGRVAASRGTAASAASVVGTNGRRDGDEDDSGGYKRPPDDLTQFTERPPSPNVTLSPDRERLLYLHKPPPLPNVATLAREEVKLAGVRVDGEQNSSSRMGHQTKLSVGALPTREEEIGVSVDFEGAPEGALLNT